MTASHRRQQEAASVSDAGSEVRRLPEHLKCLSQALARANRHEAPSWKFCVTQVGFVMLHDITSALRWLHTMIEMREATRRRQRSIGPPRCDLRKTKLELIVA